MMSLAVRTQRSGHVVVTVTGEIDGSGADKLLHRLDRLVAQGRDRIVLDLSGVRFCGAQALSALVRTRARAERAGGWLRLVGIPHAMRRVLGLTDLDRLFPRYADVADALTGRRLPSVATKWTGL